VTVATRERESVLRDGDSKITDVDIDIPCVVMSIDCQCWIFVDGYYTNTIYAVLDIRIVHFQGKIL
jgi:hypothetical protein